MKTGNEMTIWITPQDYGATGDNDADDTPALQRWIDAGATLGAGLLLTAPSAAYKVSSLVISAPVRMRSSGANANGAPIFVHAGGGALFKIRSSDVHLSGFQVWCESNKKALADVEPTFLMDTASIGPGVVLDRIVIEDFILKWTGGILHDNGGAGAWQGTRLRGFKAYVQRGTAFKWRRGFASIFVSDCYVDKNRGGSFYGDEVLAEFNYPMVDANVPAEIPGAGGYFFERARLAGSNYAPATMDHAFYLGQDGHGGGGFRLHETDVDAAAGDAFNARFLDEVEIHNCRFSSVFGNGVVLRDIGNLVGAGNRLDGRDSAGTYALHIRGGCRKIDFAALVTKYGGAGSSAAPFRVEGLGNSQLSVDLKGDGELRGPEMVSDPWFRRPILVNNPVDAVVDGQVNTNLRVTACGAVGTVGFGQPTSLDAGLIVRNVFRVNQDVTSGPQPFLDVAFGPLDLASNQWFTLDAYMRAVGAGATYDVIPQTVQMLDSGANPPPVFHTPLAIGANWTRFGVALFSPTVAPQALGAKPELRLRLLLPEKRTFSFDVCLMRARPGTRIIPLETDTGGGFSY